MFASQYNSQFVDSAVQIAEARRDCRSPLTDPEWHAKLYYMKAKLTSQLVVRSTKGNSCFNNSLVSVIHSHSYTAQ